MELPRVDQVSDVSRQLAEEKDRLNLLHCGGLQGVERVPQDSGPVVAAASSHLLVLWEALRP